METDRRWQALLSVLAADDLADPAFATNAGRLRHRATIEERIGARTRHWNKWELMGALLSRGVPAGAVVKEGELQNLHVLRERGVCEELQDELTGSRMALTFPAVFNAFRLSVGGRPPRFGEHTEAVLRAAGLSEAEIDRLRRAQVTSRQPLGMGVQLRG